MGAMWMGTVVPRKPSPAPKGKRKSVESEKSKKGCPERLTKDCRRTGDQIVMPKEGPQEVACCHRFPPGLSLASFPRVVRPSRKPVD